MNQLVDSAATSRRDCSGCSRARERSPSGSDADIVVWDSEKPLTLSAATHHSNVDYNLFEGTEVIGAPELVLVRGQVIVENDELVAARRRSVHRPGAVRRGAARRAEGGPGRPVSGT